MFLLQFANFGLSSILGTIQDWHSCQLDWPKSILLGIFFVHLNHLQISGNWDFGLYVSFSFDKD